jgi:hypothetical protein
MLFGQRKRLEQITKAEAEGESFWTTSFSKAVRTKFVHLFTDATSEDPVYYMVARGLILRDDGKLFLDSSQWDDRNDLLHYVFKCADADMPTVIEAMLAACGHHQAIRATGNYDGAVIFSNGANRILREHRISYKLVNGEMIEFASLELHDAVVAPTLTLLAGRADLAKVEQAYRKALEEISKGDSADAITDAGTALQELLTALKCEGNALGPLIKSAKEKGFLAPHDSPMLNAIERVLHWVSADRSETGDAHKASSASLDDAWFIVHIVGAILLRLSGASRRGQ